MITNYLTFTVEENTYAIDVSAVLEVLNFTEPTAVPCALPYIEGLIYSREQGITVVNFRKRFDLPVRDIDKRSKVIVVEIDTPIDATSQRVSLYGLVADSVQDVIQIYDEELFEGAKCSIPEEFVSTVLKYNDQPLFIINYKKLFEEAGSLNIQKPANQ
ncbi:MAG: chemotaxis protein CheW [Treponema sp.]|nr:chemotaxis protein CheW [Candidatus Treponema equifaecale]